MGRARNYRHRISGRILSQVRHVPPKFPAAGPRDLREFPQWPDHPAGILSGKIEATDRSRHGGSVNRRYQQRPRRSAPARSIWEMTAARSSKQLTAFRRGLTCLYGIRITEIT